LDAIFAPGAAAFVDVAMMAPVPPLGIRVPMFLSGPGAERLAPILQRFGTPADVVGPTAGDAAARKLTRSVFFKGMSAAVWEALEAARAAGVEAWLRSDIARTLAEANAGTLERIVDGTRKHARRRAHEMSDAAALLDQLGVPSTIARATAASLERIVTEQQTPA
jgi:3-hydroxyisobutyrate dehydrogenase-like beta-hydroxyacid dehydrogenase